MTTPKQAKATASGRMYEDTPGVLYPSGTNVTGMLAKPMLVPARAKIQSEFDLEHQDYLAALIESKGFEHARLEACRQARKVWDDKAEQGTRVHQALADMIAGRFQEIAPDLDPWMKQLDRWLLDNTPTIVHSEVTAFNRTHRYATTIDTIMELDHEGDLALVELKTGGLWPEHALQLSAQEHCEFIRFDDGQEIPMPRMHRCALLHLTPDKCELVPVKTGQDTWECFLALRRVWDWQTHTAPGVLPR